MPHRALRPCGHRGCPNLRQVGESYCEVHKPMHKGDYPRRHPERQKIYSSDQWRRLRAMFLAEHPLCVNYETCHNPATVVHHIVDHENKPDLMWSWDNLRAMCSPCHTSLRGWNNASKKAEK